MHKDTILTPLEPFTPEEKSALFDKLDLLSVAELENYIGLAQNSLRHKGLEPSWRPRVEIGLQRAEIVLVREAAAAALKAEAAKAEALEPEVAAPAKAKAKSKSKKAAAVVAAATGDDADDGDDESAAAPDED
ncbi:MAG: hypothetical protein ABIZ18_10370 [Caldimonas sp.]